MISAVCVRMARTWGQFRLFPAFLNSFDLPPTGVFYLVNSMALPGTDVAANAIGAAVVAVAAAATAQ